MKKTLNNQLLGLFADIEKQLQSFKKDKRPERLHRIRVAIKKIKAILSFAGKLYEKRFYARELKPLFHAAGNIRTIQVNIKLLRSLPDLPGGLINQLKKKEVALTAAFIKNSHVYSDRIKDLAQRTTLPEKLPRKKTVKKYFKDELRKAGKKFRKEEREDMHTFRMKIKKLMYVYESLPDKLHDKIPINETAIEKLQERTGKWHDTYSAVKFLSHQHFSKKAILKLKEKEQRQFRALFRNKVNADKVLTSTF